MELVGTLEASGQIGVGVKKNIWVDYCIFVEIVMIGLAEAVHLSAMVLGWNFSRCSLVFMGAAGFFCILSALLLAVICVRVGKGREAQKRLRINGKGMWGLWVVFLLLAGSQLFFVCRGNVLYRQGDMMVETVGSFLTRDRKSVV